MAASSRHEHDNGFQQEFQRVLDSGSMQIQQKERPLLLSHIDESKQKLKSYPASSRHEQGISFQQEFQRVLDSESFQIQQQERPLLLPHILSQGKIENVPKN
jgi:hypothetical protein